MLRGDVCSTIVGTIWITYLPISLFLIKKKSDPTKTHSGSLFIFGGWGVGGGMLFSSFYLYFYLYLLPFWTENGNSWGF